MTCEAELVITAESPASGDALELVRELDEYLASLYPRESLFLLDPEEMARPDTRFFVARCEGQAVGCAAIRFLQGYAEMKRMYVRPRWRKSGIARALMDALEREARRSGIAVLRLETGVNQPEALALAHTLGFTERGPFGEYPEDELCVFMEKVLE